MNLKDIKSEIYRLALLVDDAIKGGAIGELERDLMLEKLRMLYDAVRFGDTEPIDLGDFFSLDDVGEGEQGGEQEDKQMGEQEQEGEQGGEQEIPTPIAEVEPERNDEQVAEPEPEQTEQQATEPECDCVEQQAVEVEPEPECIDEQVAEPEPELELEQTEEQATEPEPESEPESEPSAEEQPAQQQRIETLFDLDDAVSHRSRKQRVIMSLYDSSTSEVVAEEPKQSGESVQTIVEEVTEIVVVEHIAGDFESQVASEPQEQAKLAPEPQEQTKLAPELVAEIEAATEPEPQEPETEPTPTLLTVESTTVLGEVINQELTTLNDAMTTSDDIAAELMRNEPLEDLRSAIGINDRYLLIRDLFDGNSSLYEATITTLNSQDSLDDAMIHIIENFQWQNSSEGATLLMDLLKRKYA